MPDAEPLSFERRGSAAVRTPPPPALSPRLPSVRNAAIRERQWVPTAILSPKPPSGSGARDLWWFPRRSEGAAVDGPLSARLAAQKMAVSTTTALGGGNRNGVALLTNANGQHPLDVLGDPLGEGRSALYFSGR
jgi:hypothetical protein